MKRFVIPGLTVVLTLGIIATALAFAVPKASAAPQTPADVDLSARGPSVGVDVHNNQFVFWRGQNGELEQAVYNADTATFNGNNLSNLSSNMGSEPTVAVANFGGYGADSFGAQFVFWKGTSNGLWYTYWAGHGWHNAVQVPNVTNVTATPSAAFNNILGSWGPGMSEVTVFWESTEGTLWYVRLTDPLGGQDNIAGSPQFTSPHEATFSGESLGTLGSAPGASNSSNVNYSKAGGLLDGRGLVTWKGSTNSDFWYVPYTIDANSGDLIINNIAKNVAKEVPNPAGWNDVNGGPTAVEEYRASANGTIFDLAWQDNNHDMEFGHASGDQTKPNPTGFSVAGPLGDPEPAASAPSIGYWPGQDPQFDTHIYIFYKGQDGHLHEEFFNGSEAQKGWQAYSYPQFGTLG